MEINCLLDNKKMNIFRKIINLHFTYIRLEYLRVVYELMEVT